MGMKGAFFFLIGGSTSLWSGVGAAENYADAGLLPSESTSSFTIKNWKGVLIAIFSFWEAWGALLRCPRGSPQPMEAGAATCK